MNKKIVRSKDVVFFKDQSIEDLKQSKKPKCRVNFDHDSFPTAHDVLREQVVEINQNEVDYGFEHNEASMEQSIETNNTEPIKAKVVEQPQL